MDVKTSDDSDSFLGPDLPEEMVVDQAVLDILEKMLQPLSELEIEYHNHQDPERTRFISNLLAGALISSDPIKVIQNQVNFTRSVKGKQKIVSYISRGINMNPILAEQYIDTLIKKSKYYKNYTRIKRPT